jgi:hypothetical protein
LDNILRSRLLKSFMLACVLREMRMQSSGAAFALLEH